MVQGVFRDGPLSRSDLPRDRLDLARHLSAACGAPICVGNPANTATLRMHTFREASDRSIMGVTIEHGVGTSLIVGGALVQGEQFVAGEIGHVVVDEDGGPVRVRPARLPRALRRRPHVRKRLAAADAPGHAASLGDTGRALGIARSPIISALNLNEVALSGRPRSLRHVFGHGTRNRAHPHQVGRQQHSICTWPRPARTSCFRALRSWSRPQSWACPKYSDTTSITAGALPGRWRGGTCSPLIRA
ncbi:MAG: ROK family protein [Dermatophilaceae bacterium]